MFLIAHRGNINGPIPSRENHPTYIQEALDKGFDVEIDVWLINNTIYLGHDGPQYELSQFSLSNPRLWCHAKNLAALEYLLEHNCHTFSHDRDDYILTSNKYIWAYPGQPLSSQTICVMPERAKYTPQELAICKGICSDYIMSYQNIEAPL